MAAWQIEASKACCVEDVVVREVPLITTRSAHCDIPHNLELVTVSQVGTMWQQHLEFDRPCYPVCTTNTNVTAIPNL